MLTVLQEQTVKMTLDATDMNTSLLFEAFMVFYLIECAVLISVAYWYYREPRAIEKKIWDPWGVWKEIK